MAPEDVGQTEPLHHQAIQGASFGCSSGRHLATIDQHLNPIDLRQSVHCTFDLQANGALSTGGTP